MNPILALIIANIIWGAAAPIFKFSLANIPPFTLAFIRFFFAAVILLPFVFKTWQKISPKDFILTLVAGFLGVTLNISAFFLGLEKATSINAPVIASSGPVFIYLLSILVLKEKPHLKVLSGMLIAFCGVLLIIFSPILFNGNSIEFGEVQGNLLFLIATFGGVGQIIINKNILKRINPLQATFTQFLFGALTFMPLMSKELGVWSISSLDYRGWTGIIFGVFLSSALAYFLFNYAVSKLYAQEVGLFTYIDPVVSVIIAIPLVHEYPDLYFFLGSLLVFGGIFMAENRIHWHPLHKLKLTR